MKKLNNKKIADGLIYSIAAIFLLFYTPILLISLFYGDKLNYNINAKEEFLIPNIAIAGLAVLSIGVLYAIYFLLKKKNNITSSRTYIILTAFIAIANVLLYFANLYIAKCIAFLTAWDVSVVAGTASKLLAGTAIGADPYYSLYPNNVPICYFLWKILKLIPGNYRYTDYFIWAQVNCILISVTGFVTGLFAMKTTKKILPTITVTLLYSAIMCILPQKIVPYTDISTMCFPVLVLLLYAFYCESKNKARYFLWIPISLLAALGGTIKTTVIIVLIAVIITEIIRLLSGKKSYPEYLLVLGSVIVFIVLYVSLNSFYYSQTGFERNKQAEVSWQHYFYMGSMDETDGAFNSESMAVYNLYPDGGGNERRKEELRLASDIIRNRSFADNIYHYIKKMVMTFNDGTFTWKGEGAFVFAEYTNMPILKFTSLFRNIFLYDSKHYYEFTTICQYLWFIVLSGLPISGIIVFVNKKKRNADKYSFTRLSLSVTALGIFFFIMLFEARGRYLITYIPLFILIAIIAIFDLFEILSSAKSSK